MSHVPNFIVMLTWHDKTVENAIEVFEEAKNAPVKYWGFKEVGLPADKMKDLVKRIKAAGKIACLEVVDYTEEGCKAGAKLAAECKFDILMGTLYFDSVKAIADAAGLRYMPFVGSISGRPSILEGSIQGMIDEANNLVKEKDLDGFDLLGYRYTGDAVKLNSEFVKNVHADVCLAGSVSSMQRLDEVKATGAWAYTIGSAFFDHMFGEGSFLEQIQTVVKYMNS